MSFEGRLRSANWTVEPCDHGHAIDLIAQFHYAKGGSHTAIYTHGLWDEIGGLFGAALWLCPTKAACLTVDPDDWKQVISLSRLVIHPSVPKNACSFLIARSIRLIRRDGRFRSLVSYADTSQGHTGLIYRASGWTYMGMTKATPRWVDPITGQQRSQYSSKNRTTEQMRKLGFINEGRFVKHKFVRYLDPVLHARFCTV